MSKLALKNWIPDQLREKNGLYTCKWLFTNGNQFTGPFFSESIGEYLSHAYNSNKFKPCSDISVLPEWASLMSSVAPTAFIFHISRCGSTLISQSLCLNSQHIVLPEVPFIDEILRLGKNLPVPHHEELVKAVIKIYGQNPDGEKKHLIIKTDSWHIHFMPLLRKLYPEVPFVLLYRKPDEVVRSHQKLRGMQAVPGVVPNELLGIKNGDVEPGDFDGHTVKVLENYFKAFIRASQEDPLTLLLNYNDGIMENMGRFCSFTNISLSAEDWEHINVRSRFNAKHPNQVFYEVQPEEKIPLYQKQAFEYYHQLENLRKTQITTA
ncbi:hypothetical protein [Pedobacter sp. UBA5917]|jgi:hypothetical protein|uniref:hypothetical protein n=1 Tax=Pedobacter sp. UBA5917 TaxID=1947061 RepID=UPI0025E21636|nr:hypothetical protein [Pedobacter sp. UBA5917]